MNLLTLNNRFVNLPITSNNIAEVNGYCKALIDITDYLKKVTEFKPEKRWVDSVKILESISETNASLTELHKLNEAELNELKGSDFDSEKVKEFLNKQTFQ